MLLSNAWPCTHSVVNGARLFCERESFKSLWEFESMEIAVIKLKTCKSFVEIVRVASLGRTKFRTDEKVKTKKKCEEWEEMWNSDGFND